MEPARIEAFGARLAVAAPGDDEVGAILDALPGAARVAAPEALAADCCLRLEPDGSGWVVADEERVARHDSRTAALDDAISRLHFHVAVHARDAVFLHAGVARFAGRLILIPGRTFTGKSTLTMALVEAGGEYYSDEYAPIDASGLVLPYRKRPSIRAGSPVSARGPFETPEPPAGRCDLVLGCEFRAGATWAPQRLSDGQGALLLVANAVVAQTRPDATARAVASVLRTATAYRTLRPTVAAAVEGVRRLLAELPEPAYAGGSS
jgi:hypothetical protein